MAITLEKIIAFLKIFLKFAFCWPVPMTATKSEIIQYKILRCVCILHGTMGGIWATYTLFADSYENMYYVMKLACIAAASIHIPIQIILYSLEHDRLQIIIHEMEHFIDIAKSEEEREIFQRYINKCILFNTIMIIWVSVALLCMMLGAILLDQPFPMDVQYPFNAMQQPLRTIIYVHHLLLIYQSFSKVCSNVFIALLLWFLVARFEILSCKFRRIKNVSDFLICARQHQQLLQYAKNTTTSLRFVSLSGIIVTVIAVVFAGLTILSREPFPVKAQFLTMAISTLLKIFIFTWPADSLLTTSNEVAQAAYESMWFEKDISVQKGLIYIIARSQQPVTLHIPCLLPNLSLSYYASFLSSIFSYLTAFRTVLGVTDED